jgi:Skp family chaperone for outer membrane proteins
VEIPLQARDHLLINQKKADRFVNPSMERTMARWAPAVLGLVLVAGVAGNTSAQQGQSIAVVNLSIVMEQTPGYEEARNTYQQEMEGFQQEVERMRVEYDSIVRAYDQQQVMLSPTAREEKLTEIRQLEQRLTQRGQELQIRAQARERELVAPLEERVRAVVEGLRAERNIAVVFDVSQPTTGIVAADRTLDLTATVVQRLQGGQPQQ